MTRTLTLHIGYPKNASTFLQRTLFADIGAYGKAAGKPGNLPISQARMLRWILDGDPEQWRRDVGKELLNAWLGKAQRDRMVWTEEDWLWGPARMSPPQKCQRDLKSDRHLVVEHLHFLREGLAELGVRLKAFAIVRNQAEFLPSMYNQTAGRRHRVAGQADFEHCVDDILNDESMRGWRFLDYHRLLRDLSAELGEDNARLLFHADMHLREFWQSMAEFIGIDFPIETYRQAEPVNKKSVGDKKWQCPVPRYLGSQHPMVERLGQWTEQRTGRNIADGLLVVERRYRRMLELTLPEALERRIGERYRDCNAELCRHLGRTGF